MKVKLFFCNCPLRKTRADGKKRINHEQFEHEINTWLEQHPNIQISRIEQSASGGSFSESLWLVSIWYD